MTAPRLRWEGDTFGGYLGYAGTLPDSAYHVWPPTFSDEWSLTSALPAQGPARRPPGLSLGYADNPGELKDRAEELLAEFITSLGAVFPAAPGDRVPAPGPFDDRQQVRDLPAVAAIYEAMHKSYRRGVGEELNHRMLCESISAAGIGLGAHEHRIVQLMAGDEPTTVAVWALLIERAHQAGYNAGAGDAW